ncbi:MAG: four helix bundle protein [Acidobacteria bacterium]|nr:four helix bundle protein [Acidobacteriota bacterium]
MVPSQRFDQVLAWQKAHALVLRIYAATRGFPREERFGLSSQMRRAAVSVPANIAEGYKRRGRADKIRCLNIAQASLEELRYYLILGRDLNYLEAYEEIHSELDEASRLLAGYIAGIENRG